MFRSFLLILAQLFFEGLIFLAVLAVAVSLAIYDASDGRLLWADVRPLLRLSPENLKFRVPEIVADLP